MCGIAQGPLQIWTEHSPQSPFLKLQLRGTTLEPPGPHFGFEYV